MFCLIFYYETFFNLSSYSVLSPLIFLLLDCFFTVPTVLFHGLGSHSVSRRHAGVQRLSMRDSESSCKPTAHRHYLINNQMQTSLLWFYVHYVVIKVTLDLKCGKRVEIQARDRVLRKMPAVCDNIQTWEILIQISVLSANITDNCSKNKFKIIQRHWNWNSPLLRGSVYIQKQIVSNELQRDWARKRIFSLYM